MRTGPSPISTTGMWGRSSIGMRSGARAGPHVRQQCAPRCCRTYASWRGADGKQTCKRNELTGSRTSRAENTCTRGERRGARGPATSSVAARAERSVSVRRPARGRRRASLAASSCHHGVAGSVRRSLEEVRWSELRHAYGTASDLPGVLTALASPIAQEREDALTELVGRICHQGTVYSASSAAVPFMIELLEQDGFECKEDVLDLLRRIAEASCPWETGIPFGTHERRRQYDRLSPRTLLRPIGHRATFNCNATLASAAAWPSIPAFSRIHPRRCERSQPLDGLVWRAVRRLGTSARNSARTGEKRPGAGAMLLALGLLDRFVGHSNHRRQLEQAVHATPESSAGIGAAVGLAYMLGAQAPEDVLSVLEAANQRVDSLFLVGLHRCAAG